MQLGVVEDGMYRHGGMEVKNWKHPLPVKIDNVALNSEDGMIALNVDKPSRKGVHIDI